LTKDKAGAELRMTERRMWSLTISRSYETILGGLSEEGRRGCGWGGGQNVRTWDLGLKELGPGKVEVTGSGF